MRTSGGTVGSRRRPAWGLRVGAVATVAAAALAATSCGGGSAGSFAAEPMVLVEFLFVDRSLTPSFPTGVQALPRNAQIVFVFSEHVDPASIDGQSIAIRYGPQFASTPKGSFQVDGTRVLFDPTVTVQGQPNPFGFDPVTQYDVFLPAQGQANHVVRNLDAGPLLAPFLTQFVTSEGFLRELIPPQVLDCRFVPPADPVTKQIPGNGVMALDFSEAIDPASIELSVAAPAPLLTDTLDVRYANLTPDPNVNSNDALENVPVPGTFWWSPGATTYFFKPTFSFGTKKYVFNVTAFQGVTDLAGNQLVNPRSFGPFTCDGTGIQNGRVLVESFDLQTDMDPGSPTSAGTTADWGATEQGILQGEPITSRRTYVTGYEEALREQAGWYNAVVDPLIGADLNQAVPGINPPTNLGRRVLWAFSETDMGARGSVTAASWGPDSNATFAAKYPDVVLRIGFQKTGSMSLSSTFGGNYLGAPLVVYKGPYDVQQALNVGDEILPLPQNTLTIPNAAQLDPLFNYTGFTDWPALTSYFDWEPTVGKVMLFDASVKEGDSWNQIRGWYGVTYPFSPTLVPGYPMRRMYATYEEDVPNPPSNANLQIYNPEPSLTDTAFTLTARKSLAQSRFYTPAPGDPSLNPGGPPTPPFSSQWTYGAKSDYLPAQVLPVIQSGGAQVLVEFQGATALDTTGNRTVVNASFPSTPWTANVDDCDGYPYIRWRVSLIGNLISNKTARLSSVTIPILPLP